MVVVSGRIDGWWNEVGFTANVMNASSQVTFVLNRAGERCLRTATGGVSLDNAFDLIEGHPTLWRCRIIRKQDWVRVQD